MERFGGLTRTIHEAVPAELVPVFWVVTLFGSVKFLLVCLSVAYWSLEAHRDALRRLLAVVVVGLAVTLAVKYWFTLPRPPVEMHRYPVEPTPYAFPSGHAVASTTAFGGALVLVDDLRDAKTTAAATALVLAIGVSRVALGIHYVGDVLAGFAVGLAVIGVTTVVVRRHVALGFGLAVACSVVALVLSDAAHNPAVVAGSSVGALLATLWLSVADHDATDPPERVRSTRWSAVLTGLVVVGCLGAVGRVVGPWPVTLGAFVAAGGATVALPAVFERYDPLAAVGLSFRT